MNENLNLVNILKDCPRGTKLYSIPHGEVEFYQITVGYTDHPICFQFKTKKGDIYMVTVTADGKYANADGECILFPSKDQRDWSKFNIEPKFDINTLQPFDKVLTRDFNDSMWKSNFYEGFTRNKDYPFITMRGLYKQCIPYNDETKHLVGTYKMPPKKYVTWEENL